MRCQNCQRETKQMVVSKAKQNRNRAGHPKERLKSVFTVGPTAALAHRQINFLSLASPGLRGIQKLRGQNF